MRQTPPVAIPYSLVIADFNGGTAQSALQSFLRRPAEGLRFAPTAADLRGVDPDKPQTTAIAQDQSVTVNGAFDQGLLCMVVPRVAFRLGESRIKE